MTADGEIYIDGDCTETFREELDAVFGKGNWKIDDSPFTDSWDMSIFPLLVDVLVLDMHNNIIGKATIQSKAIVVDNGMGRSIDLEPEKIEITKM